MKPSLLVAKAEVVLGVLLAVRHRTVRLVLLLALVAITLAALSEARGSGDMERTVLVAGAMVAAVAASRPYAPGAALFSARCAAGRWWLAPVGRLTGVWLVALAVILLGTVLLSDGPGASAALRLAFAAALYAAALGAATLGVTPFVGATGAGSIGIMAAWFGPFPPSAVALLFDDLPYVQRPLVLLWNVLPLDWRASRWLRAGTGEDVLLLLAWVVGGILLAAWGAAQYYRRERPPAPLV